MKFITDNTKNPKALWNLMKNTATKWSLDQAPRLGAALAYYATFSLAPLLIIAIAISGLVFGAKQRPVRLLGKFKVWLDRIRPRQFRQ